MSPLHTSSTSSHCDYTLSLPMLPRSCDRHVDASARDSQYPQSRILDVAVASGIVALLVALLIPSFNSHDLPLPSATRGLVDNLRLARAGATSHGAHFRVTLQPQTYAIEQLQDQDGNGIWESDAKHSAWQITLPPTVVIGTGAGTVIEFDVRGLIVSASSSRTETPVIVELTDSHTKKSEMIEILSSGKVQRS